MEILFCYGILKRGFKLDLHKYGAEFLGEAIFSGAKIYQIGSGVGLSLSPDALSVVHGEAFQVSTTDLWKWLDTIEGHPYNYKRELLEIQIKNWTLPTKAWVYIHQHPNCFGKQIKSGRYENADIRV